MSTTANPVADGLDAMPDDRVRYGDSAFWMGLKQIPGTEALPTHAQAVYDVVAAAMAQVTIDQRAALILALSGNTTELATLNDTETSGNALLTQVRDALGVLTTAMSTLIDKEQATVDALAKLNGYNATIASGSATGSNYAMDFAAAGSSSVMPAAMAADAKLLRVIVSAATLLGTVLGGGAKLYVYHCAGASDAYNASGAVLLGTYPVASNSSYVSLTGRTIPKGRYLRAQASNGGCSISMDVA